MNDDFYSNDDFFVDDDFYDTEYDAPDMSTEDLIDLLNELAEAQPEDESEPRKPPKPIPARPPRAIPYQREIFKRNVLNMVMGSMTDPDAYRDADLIQQFYIIRLYKEFMKLARTNPPQGLYSMALMLSDLYDELFWNGEN